MKVSLVYVYAMIGILQMVAHAGRGQNLDDINVTVGLEDGSLSTLFTDIQSQSGLSFNFYNNEVEKYKVTIPMGTWSVRAVLDLALKETTLMYYQFNSVVVVLEKGKERAGNVLSDKVTDGGKSAVLSFTVTGKVMEAGTNELLAGVNVLVKGTTIGTTTNAEGEYAIDVNANDVLVFSFIGFKTQEVSVSTQTEININLETDIASLQEVTINAGYWNVTEREKTGNISRVTSEVIERQSVTNPLVALQGRMPGVFIQQSSGVPGGKINIQIRGRNSMQRSGNEPLYIVDGVPFISSALGSNLINLESTQGGNPLNILNPSDIESIEILKDADATAVYGSLGSNGVVLITTKKAKAGRTKFDVNVYTGIGRVANKMDLLNTTQYLEMRHEAFKNDGAEPQPWDYDLTEWDTTRYTDWQKEFMGGTSNITNAQASISGGDKNTLFLLGTGYYKEGTVFPGNFSYDKFSSHLTVTHATDNQKFNSTLSINFALDKNTLPYRDGTFFALQLAPNAPSLYDEEGNLNWANNTFSNPLSSFVRSYEAKTTNLITNGQLSYKIFPGLLVKANFGYASIRLREMRLIPKSSFNPTSSSKASSYFGDDNNNTWLIEPQVDYNRKIGKGIFTALIGMTLRESSDDRQLLNATGYSSDSFLRNIQAAADVAVADYSYYKYRYNAIFSRINYSWDEKYIFNLTGRRDGSSRFGPGKQFANFGAVGIAWIFSNETFINKSQNVLSFGKLRASFGTTGNDQIGDYQFLDTYKPTYYSYLGNAGLEPTRLANSDYAWETNRKFEVALDLGFFNDRVFIATSYYRNRSSNQLVGYPLASTTGFSFIQDNFPATVQNTGVELMLNTTNIKSVNFTWTSSVNVTIPKNELVSFPNLKVSSYNYLYEVGKSLFVYKGLQMAGVDAQTGLFTFNDTDGDGGVVYPDDLQAEKEIRQSFYGGFQNSLVYKRLQLDVFFQFVKQTGKNEFANPYRNVPGMMGNQPAGVMNRWQKAGDNATHQKFTQDYADAYTSYSDYLYLSDGIIGDASFIRLKNVSLSYNLPDKWSRKLSVQGIKVYVQGQNLLTFTKYKGIDPESQNFESLPPLRIITVGVQLTF